MASFGSVWEGLKKIDRLLDLEEKQRLATNALRQEINALADRMTRLEAREELVVEKAKGAAGAGASAMVAEMARRIGVLEERSVPQTTPPSKPKKNSALKS